MDGNQTLRSILTEEELSELIPFSKEATIEFQQQSPPVDTENLMMEQTLRFWEQSVRDLQMEVRELRDRIERMERQHKYENQKLRSMPVTAGSIAEPATEQAPSSERLSRTDRIKSQRNRWF